MTPLLRVLFVSVAMVVMFAIAAKPRPIVVVVQVEAPPPVAPPAVRPVVWMSPSICWGYDARTSSIDLRPWCGSRF